MSRGGMSATTPHCWCSSVSISSGHVGFRRCKVCNFLWSNSLSKSELPLLDVFSVSFTSDRYQICTWIQTAQAEILLLIMSGVTPRGWSIIMLQRRHTCHRCSGLAMGSTQCFVSADYRHNFSAISSGITAAEGLRC